jgi:GNAT superfamily N-acetyltransferase
MFYIMADLKESYWAPDRTKETMVEAMAGSVCLGLYCDDRQIGFARAVTDKCTFAWVCDVMVHRDYRGVGLGKFLMDCLHEHPEVARCRQLLLRTDDAHGLYEQFGYSICEAMARRKEIT